MISISNQRPQVLSPDYDIPSKGDFDPVSAIKQTLATPLWEPLNQSVPVTIDCDGQTLSEDDIAMIIPDIASDVVAPAQEDLLRELYAKSLVSFDPTNPLTMTNLFAMQAGTAEKMDPPSDTCVYTPFTDVIPTAKELLGGMCSFDKWFATLHYFARPKTLGMSFMTSVDFEDFKQFISAQVQGIASLLPADTVNLFNNFDKLKLTGLTESLMIRKDSNDGNDEFSFARMLVNFMMAYCRQNQTGAVGILPFDLGELFIPETVVFVNVEAHSHSNGRKIKEEWDLINKSIQSPVRIVPKNKLQKLTSAVRSTSKLAYGASMAMRKAQAQRSLEARFKSKPPSTPDLLKMIRKVMDKMGVVMRSENSYKQIRMSFARPNRRDPDDFNKQGKIVSTIYRPDIHLYIDTSGSISEDNYKEMILSCIHLARKLNINLYFNSFSHMLSEATLLPVKGRSTKQIYQQFRKVPKVGGGTDYEQIWKYINNSKKRQRELSLIITDFEYYAPNHFVEHPKNLYYVPCSHTDWNSIKHWAQAFCSSMRHIDANVRRKLLF